MKYLNILFIIFILSGCVNNIPTPLERKSSVLQTALGNNFHEVDIETSTFTLFSLQKQNNNCKNKNLRVYVEGDGLSWITRRTISKDPTPVNSTILKLMYEDTTECKVYLARPCQFINSDICDKKYWTSHRFSPEVIKSFDESLNNLKKEYKNKSFTLIGHSGGGAVVALLASNRKDIDMFVTIAGNMDIEKWTSMYNLSKLEGSLNPADFTNKLENTKQYHLIGNNDKIVPKEVFLAYLSKFKNKDKVHFLYFDENHNCCWENPFKKLLFETK